MEAVEVPVTDRANEMSVDNGTTANVCIFNVGDYHQSDRFVRFRQVADQNILLPDINLS